MISQFIPLNKLAWRSNELRFVRLPISVGRVPLVNNKNGCYSKHCKNYKYIYIYIYIYIIIQSLLYYITRNA